MTSSNSKRNNETLIARFKGHIAAVACILCFFLSLEMPQLFLTLYVYDHTTGKKTGSRPITEVKPCPGEVSTSLGDHLGTPRVVGFFVSFSFALIDFVLVSILLFYSKGRLVF